MKNYRIKLLMVFLTLVSVQLMAQDIITRINPRRQIACKVIEIGEEQVRYRSSEFSDSLVFSIDTRNIEQILFANGKVYKPTSRMFDKESYDSQHKNALKFTFISPVLGYVGLSYEKSIKPGSSMEFGLNIIGAGWDFDNRNPIGLGLRAGYKFMTSPDYYQRHMLYSHILKGMYVEPQVGFTLYASDENSYTYSYNSDYYNSYMYYNSTTQRKTTALVTVGVLGGKQWVFDDRFLIDLNIGIGYGFGTLENNGMHYGFSGTTDGVPLCFMSAFKIGYLF